jgi:hypothetical protein
VIDAPSAPGSTTSRQAAVAIVDHAAAQRELVMQHIRAAGVHGLTRKEIEAATGLSGDSVRPRCWELLGNGGHPVRLAISDEVRRTASGRPCEVLLALEFAP